MCCSSAAAACFCKDVPTQSPSSALRLWFPTNFADRGYFELLSKRREVHWWRWLDGNQQWGCEWQQCRIWPAWGWNGHAEQFVFLYFFHGEMPKQAVLPGLLLPSCSHAWYYRMQGNASCVVLTQRFWLGDNGFVRRLCLGCVWARSLSPFLPISDPQDLAILGLTSHAALLWEMLRAGMLTE